MRHGGPTIGIGCFLLAAICVACVAGAQQTGQHAPGGRIGDGFALLLMPGVQKELKLSAEQVGRVLKQWQAVQKLAELNPEADQVPTPEQQEKIGAEQQEMEQKAATELLDAGQQHRLGQILLQARGPGLLLRAEVTAKLELNAVQRTTIRDILKQAGIQRTAILRTQPADNAARQTQHADLIALRQSAATKAQAVLTAGQQKKWRSMLGEPFDIEARN